MSTSRPALALPSNRASSTPRPYAAPRTLTASVPPPLVRNRTSPAHLPLYRRLLFPHHPPQEDVLPIVIGQGEEIKLINERLHHLIALALRACILSWYTRFSKDRSLLPSIHSTILRPTLSPILQNIHDDPQTLCEFILLDLPSLLALHFRVYWEAKASDYIFHRGLGTSYHDRLPLRSVAPTIKADEDDDAPCEYALSPLYLSTLATALLPSTAEQPQPDVQRLMAREVLARSVLLSVGKRLSQPWFWHSLLLKYVGEPGDPSLLSSKTKASSTTVEEHTIPEYLWRFTARFVGVIVGIWNLIVGVMTIYTASPPSSEYTANYAKCIQPTTSLVRQILGIDGRAGMSEKSWLARLAWNVVEVLSVLLGPILDRILPHIILTYVLTPKTALKLIDIVERILFPDGYPGPSPIDPTPAEAQALKDRFDTRLTEIIPRPIRVAFCPSEKDVAKLLEPLSDSSCNAHLVGMVLDSLVAAIRPDLVVGEPASIQPQAQDQGRDQEDQTYKEEVMGTRS